MSVTAAQAIDLASGTDTVLDRSYAPSLPPKLSGTMRNVDEEVVPIGGVASNRITFQVPGQSASSGGWISLADSYISLRLALRLSGAIVANNLGGVDTLTAGPLQLVAPETNFVHAIFSKISLFLASVDVSDDSGNYEFLSAFYRDALTKPRGYGRSLVTTSNYVDQTPEPSSALPSTFAQFRRAVYADTGEGFQTGAVYADRVADGATINLAISQQRATLLWRVVRMDSLAGGANPTTIVEFIYKPECGLFNTGYVDEAGKRHPYLIPPSLDLRLELDKGNPDAPFRSAYGKSQLAGYIDWTQSSASFFVHRKYPDRAVAEALAAESLERSFLYPMLRARVHAQTFAATDSSVNVVGLLAGARPDVAVIAFYDSVALAKTPVTTWNGAPLGVAIGGQQLSLYQSSGQAYAPGLLDGSGGNVTSAYAPQVTSIQVSWGSKVVPQTMLRQPTPLDCARGYEMYRRACVAAGPALSFAAWSSSYTIYVFDLSDSGSAADAVAGTRSDFGDADRGSLTVTATLIPNTSYRAGEVLRPYTMITCGFGHAAAEISASRGTVRRIN